MRNNHNNIGKRILQKLSTAKSKEQSMTISKLELSPSSPITYNTSKICEGRLVARVVPKQFSNYYAHKSLARVDPAPFISSLQLSEMCDPSSRVIDSTSANSAEQKLQNVYLPRADDESVVVIDLYLIRSRYLNHEIEQTKDQQIFGMVNSFDVTRNNSNLDNDRHDNLIHLHMNRSSTELASRTLQRLQLSFARKLQSNQRCKKANRRKDESVAISSKLVLIDDTEEVCREVEFSNRSSAELFNMLSGTQAYSAIVLTLPKMILPWNDDGIVASDNDISVEEDVESLELGIISNPPTLLSVKTWENFNADIFTCVPLVVETTIIHATQACIAWFVDEKVVLHDSNVYTPTEEDIGKHISILITPTRPDHNGAGCQESYSFSSTVQVLPKMPILELKKEWSSRHTNTNNNLRVAR